MSNNCLVTKLKGTVDNGDLPKIGEIKITVAPGATKTFCLAILPVETPSDLPYARIEGNANFLDLNDNVIGKSLVWGDVISGGRSANQISVSPSNSEVIVFVTARYDSYFFTADSDTSGRMSMNIEDFSYNSNTFTYFTPIDIYGYKGIKIYGDVTNLKLSVGRNANNGLFLAGPTIQGNLNGVIERSPNLYMLSTYDSKVRVDVTSLINCTNVVLLYLGGETYGDIALLGNIHSLQQLYVTHGGVMTHFTGSIEDFVQNAKTRGAGSIVMPWPGNFTEITYRGVKLPAAIETEGGPYSSSTNTLHWDAQGNISWSAS